MPPHCNCRKYGELSSRRSRKRLVRTFTSSFMLVTIIVVGLSSIRASAALGLASSSSLPPSSSSSGADATAAAAAAAKLWCRAELAYPLRNLSESRRLESRNDYLQALAIEPSWKRPSSKLVSRDSINDALSGFDCQNSHVSGDALETAQRATWVLRESGIFSIFTAESVRERIGGVPPSSSIGEAGPYHMRRHVDHTTPSFRTPPEPSDRLDVFIQLFLLGLTVPEELTVNLLGAECLDALKNLGAVDQAPLDDLDLLANVQFFPMRVEERDFIFATDFHPPCSVNLRQSPVMYIGVDSICLARLFAPTVRANLVLDLCTGSGVQGIVAAARYADRVICVDLNPRAIRFARFNSLLNGVADRVTVMPASNLYDSLDDSRVFDVILANPPFVPVPPEENPQEGRYTLFADGGPGGEDILRDIFQGMRGFLRRPNGKDHPGGVVAVVTELMNVEDIPARLESWWGPDRAQVGGLFGSVFHDQPRTVTEYASKRGGRLGAKAWEAHMERQGITSVSNALIVLCHKEEEDLPGSQRIQLEEKTNLWVPHSRSTLTD